MNELIKIGNQELAPKEFRGQRVVTFKDIDLVHERPEGTADRNFRENYDRFSEEEDYIQVSKSQNNEIRGLEIPNRGLTLITEQGYLMLVKSFNDDLAWKVQRDLVGSYFKSREVIIPIASLSPELQMFKQIFDSQIKQYAEMQSVKEEVIKTNERIDSIREVVALDTTSWREDTSNLLRKVGVSLGGGQAYSEVRTESYTLLDK